MRSVAFKPSPSKAGFTLMELLTVITILGIVSSIAGISMFSAVQKSQARQCGSNLLILENAKDSYLIDHPGADIPDNAALIPYIKSQNLINYLNTPVGTTPAPVCLAGGTYSNLTNRLQKCACSLNGLNGDTLTDGLHDPGY